MIMNQDEIDSKVFRCIMEYRREHVISPSIRDIQQRCELSSANTAFRSLRRLERAGLIAYPNTGSEQRPARSVYVPEEALKNIRSSEKDGESEAD